LAKGSDPTLSDDNDLTPLAIAEAAEQIECRDLLERRLKMEGSSSGKGERRKERVRGDRSSRRRGGEVEETDAPAKDGETSEAKTRQQLEERRKKRLERRKQKPEDGD